MIANKFHRVSIHLEILPRFYFYLFFYHQWINLGKDSVDFGKNYDRDTSKSNLLTDCYYAKKRHGSNITKNQNSFEI